MNVFTNIEKFSSNIAVITEESKKITYKELLIYSKKISNKISNNTLVLIIVTFYFNKISSDLKKNLTDKIKKNLIYVGCLSYLFLFLQLMLWYQLMKSGNFVDTNTYFSSFYIFTTLHGIHLLGGLFFWGKVSSRIFKLNEKD